MFLGVFSFPAGVFGKNPVFIVEESEKMNSKHRKRVPTSVFCLPCSAAASAKLLLGSVPNPRNGKERQSMDGRKRTVQIKFRVTEAERDLIEEKNEADTHPEHGGVSAEDCH